MAVPDTTTFSLQDVVDEVVPTTNDLVDCFASADADKFNSEYQGSKDRLLNFRNYGAQNLVLTNVLVGQFWETQAQAAASNSFSEAVYLYLDTIPNPDEWQLFLGDFIFSDEFEATYVGDPAERYTRVTGNTSDPVTVVELAATTGEVISRVEMTERPRLIYSPSYSTSALACSASINTLNSYFTRLTPAVGVQVYIHSTDVALTSGSDLWYKGSIVAGDDIVVQIDTSGKISNIVSC